MGEKTNIAWTDSTWNPFRGCDKVSPGCANCYITGTPPFRTTGQKHGDPIVLASEATWHDPFRWNKKPWVCDDCGKAYPATMHEGKFEICPDCFHAKDRSSLHRRHVFAPSLSDWLYPGLPIEALARFLDTIRQCENLIFILCTKRPELWRERIMAVYEDCDNSEDPEMFEWLEWWLDGNAISNIWILASAENQEWADKRIPELLNIPAVVRGLSCEPLLGPINLDYYDRCQGCGYTPKDRQTLGDHHLCKNPTPTIDWVIVGGESGSKARPCNVEWIRSIKDQCQSAGVSCFVKQLGSNATRDLSDVMPSSYVEHESCDPADIAAWEHHRKHCPMHLTHPKGGDPAEWPEDLRVQQFPKV